MRGKQVAWWGTLLMAFVRAIVAGPQHAASAQDASWSTCNEDGYKVYRAGKYTQAEKLFGIALKAAEEFGVSDDRLGISLTNLAQVYSAQARYDRAEPLYNRSLAIWEKALGPDHPNIASSLNNLGWLHVKQAKYDQAEQFYARSLAIREKSLGPDHPDVAVSLSNLGGLYCRQVNYDWAEPLIRRSLAIFEKVFGSDHPNVAFSLENYAVLLKATNRTAEAEAMLKRAAEIRERGKAKP
ncbi:MAG: tetratricopeptide repeat protein [Tepidisphaeraceae bacterium]|jgi:tetratricopeptide (TPR) repeat protein